MTRHADLLALLVRRDATVAVAESLTGGLIGATLSATPGASAAFRGGVIAYATDSKERVLGVPGELLAREGAVHPDVAGAMAAGVRDLMAATYGVAVTGVAGPEPQDGKPVGTVHIAVSGPESRFWHKNLRLSGSRDEIREETTQEAVDLLLHVVEANMKEHFG
ncbi:nicotinamide-nucleotide amidohydrolase family protein [Streptosporangium sp. KLBMP 9127]|nr:nicotinamide-nucleotide amidohydrolase family protein [Streptosporangium sp. KLBMP 9127]